MFEGIVQRFWLIAAVASAAIALWPHPAVSGKKKQSDCEAERMVCEQKCRSLPANAKRERFLCWSRCNEDYANCIRSLR